MVHPERDCVSMVVHILTPAGMIVKPIHEASAVHAALTASMSLAEQLVSWQGPNLKHVVSGNISHVTVCASTFDMPAIVSARSAVSLPTAPQPMHTPFADGPTCGIVNRLECAFVPTVSQWMRVT